MYWHAHAPHDPASSPAPSRASGIRDCVRRASESVRPGERGATIRVRGAARGLPEVRQLAQRRAADLKQQTTEPRALSIAAARARSEREVAARADAGGEAAVPATVPVLCHLVAPAAQDARHGEEAPKCCNSRNEVQLGAERM